MSEGILIRAMRAADVAGVMEIAASLHYTSHWPRVAYLTALDPHAELRRVALVAVDASSDVPAAYAIACLLGAQAELETIAVAAHHQRQGLARRLLDTLFEVLRRAAVGEVWLEVRTSNRTAIGLYRRTGFVETGLRKRYYTDPIEDAVTMSLLLG